VIIGADGLGSNASGEFCFRAISSEATGSHSECRSPMKPTLSPRRCRRAANPTDGSGQNDENHPTSGSRQAGAPGDPDPSPPALSALALLRASEPARLVPAGLLLALVRDHHQPAPAAARAALRHFGRDARAALSREVRPGPVAAAFEEAGVASRDA
jgi:hypothetical protein